MIAWVTGAQGFIGRHLAQHLARQGHVVCGVGHGYLRQELWPQAGLVRWVDSELCNEALDLLVAAQGTPDVVYHLAGGSSVGASLQAPWEDFRRTTTSTALLLEWLRTKAPQAKLVVASSAAVYGDTGGLPATETCAPRPVSPYGHHKLMMEQLCREYSQIYGLASASVRLFSVYGEGLRKQLLWDSAVKLFEPGESIELGGTGAELRDWIHVDDAVALLERAATYATEASQVFNGGSGSGVTVREIVTLLADGLGRTKRVMFSGYIRPGDPRTLIAATACSEAIGHHCTVRLTDGVRRYADWFNHERRR